MDVDCGGGGGDNNMNKDEISCITVSRSDDIANMRLKYEDQLEQYRQQIRQMEAKNTNLLGLLGKPSSQVLHQAPS